MHLTPEILVQFYINISARLPYLPEELPAFIAELVELDSLIVEYHRASQDNFAEYPSEDERFDLWHALFRDKRSALPPLTQYQYDILMKCSFATCDIASYEKIAVEYYEQLKSIDKTFYSLNQVRNYAYLSMYAIMHFIGLHQEVIQENHWPSHNAVSLSPQHIIKSFTLSLSDTWYDFNRVHSSNIFVCLMPIESQVSKLCHLFEKTQLSHQHLKSKSESSDTITHFDIKINQSLELLNILRELMSLLDIEMSCPYINRSYLFNLVLFKKTKYLVIEISKGIEHLLKAKESAIDKLSKSVENTTNDTPAITEELNTLQPFLAGLNYVMNGLNKPIYGAIEIGSIIGKMLAPQDKKIKDTTVESAANVTPR